MQNTHSTLQLKMCLFKSKMFALLLWVYNFKKMESWRKWVSECPVNVLLNSFLASGDFCHLLIIFANSLDQAQDRQNVNPDLDPNCLTL